jgi:hypothetical protein
MMVVALALIMMAGGLDATQAVQLADALTTAPPKRDAETTKPPGPVGGLGGLVLERSATAPWLTTSGSPMRHRALTT